MGRKGNLVPSEPLPLTSNAIVISYLEDLVRTGLYGATVTAAAEEIIRAEIKRLIDAGKLKERAHYAGAEE